MGSTWCHNDLSDDAPPRSLIENKQQMCRVFFFFKLQFLLLSLCFLIPLLQTSICTQSARPTAHTGLQVKLGIDPKKSRFTEFRHKESRINFKALESVN